MARLFSAATIREINQLESDHVFTMAFQLDIAGISTAWRVVNYDQDLTIFGLLFQRFPCDIDSLEEPTSGSLVHLRVTAANVDQQLMSMLENYWAPNPDPLWSISAWQIDAKAPEQAIFQAGEVFSVSQVATDFITASFDLVAEGYSLTRTVPGRRYVTSAGFPFLPRR
jgi:hypothetical protein